MSNRSSNPKCSEMRRRDFLKTAGGAGLLAASGISSSRSFAAPPAKRPNILLILTDQQHIDSISAAGCPYIQTPGMDRIVKRGVNFRLSHSTNPVCSPARSSVVTGRTTSETGVFSNGKPIRSGIPNMGQWLSEKTDYETLYAGKWHVPSTYTFNIPGFRVLHTGIGGQGNLGDTGMSRACEAFLRNRTSKRPFLLIASFMQPHDICEWLRMNMNEPGALRYPEIEDQLPPLPDNFHYDKNEPEYLKDKRAGCEPAKGGWTERQWRYYRWSYFRHVEMVDGEIERLMRTLEETGREKDTLVLLNSDHGEGMGHHHNVRKSLPYDEAMKVPLLASWPEGGVREGLTDDEHLVTGMDLMPTVCDYAGVEPPPKMRGRSLRPILEGKKVDSWHPYIVTEANSNRCRMVRSKRYKYVTYYGETVDMLFDMQRDPGETKNLADDSDHAKALEEHKGFLKEWESGLDYAPEIPYPDAWWSA